MDEPTLDPVYLKQLKPKFKKLFIQFINPDHVLHVFQTYNIHILTEFDLGNIAAETKNNGPIAGSILLFERLVLYTGWYPCLLEVLCDREVCLSHVAREMEEIKGSLDDAILQEESDDQSENNEKGLAGLSLDTNLKDPVLEKRLLKKKVELEKQKTELDKLMKMFNELMVSHEELKQIKEKQKTELEKVTEMYNELKLSHEELLHEKVATGEMKDDTHHKITIFADKELVVFLIGKTGNGKSKTGNTILGRNAFEEGSSFESVTQSVQTDVGNINGRMIKVIDGPGVGDTAEIRDVEEATLKVLSSLCSAIYCCPEGIHAFLLIVRYGCRFTKEDAECIRLLKSIFGDNFVKHYCILIVTHGDNYKKDPKNRKKKFLNWCEEQTGIFKELFLDCDRRVILFDNATDRAEKKTKQATRLLEMIDALQYGGKRYNLDNFEQTEIQRKEVVLKVKEPRVREEKTALLEDIKNDFQQITDNDLDLEKQMHSIQSIISDTRLIFDDLVKEDDNTHIYETIITLTQNYITIFEQKYESLKTHIEMKKKFNEREEHTQQKLQERNQQLKDLTDERNRAFTEMQNAQEKMLADATTKEEQIRQTMNDTIIALQEKIEKQKEDQTNQLLKLQEEKNQIQMNTTLSETERARLQRELEKKDLKFKNAAEIKQKETMSKITEIKKTADETLEKEKHALTFKMRNLQEKHDAEMSRCNEKIKKSNNEITELHKYIEGLKSGFCKTNEEYLKEKQESSQKFKDLNKNLDKEKEKNKDLEAELDKEKKDNAKSILYKLEDLKKRYNENPYSITKEEKIKLKQEIRNLQKEYKQYLKTCNIL